MKSLFATHFCLKALLKDPYCSSSSVACYYIDGFLKGNEVEGNRTDDRKSVVESTERESEFTEKGPLGRESE